MSGRELRLLALYGGGVRGLSALMILEQLMEAVDPDAPPKPCDYFDMIGGTNTGGLIAVMLGRLRMCVAECIAAYLKLSERVFRKTRHRVTVKGQIQDRFDSEELARAVRKVVTQQGLQENALLKDDSNATCKVFVCATSKETSETVCLTSYRTPRGNNDLLNSVTIWEACRATSAASSSLRSDRSRTVWDQAQLAWGPEPLEGRVKCLVPIGTGVPSLKPFKDDVLHIGTTLAAIATETEGTAAQFRRERPLLDSTGRYYRFNVDRGLEDIGLEEAKKVKEMAAATRRYIATQDKQMQACAGSIAAREYFGEYQINFSLEGVPRVSQFVDRPAEMETLEQVLLPKRKSRSRQKVHVLHGLGGMGKTQLVVEFARRHHRQFSAVLWLDGRSEGSLKRSIASCARKIPQGQIPDVSRSYATDSHTDVDAVVKDVMDWLARPDNGAWLLIFDNVDREYSKGGSDPDAYDVKRYLSGADHGCVLITTRLAKLEQLGESQQLGKVNDKQAQAILQTWYKKPYDTAEGDRLLRLLDGLPLAIAQAGAYLQESGVGLKTYLRFYEHVWTTWAISYQAIRDKHEHTANLLLLWSFLNNKGLWHRLFAAACKASADAAEILSAWVGDIASNKVAFSQAMRLLRNYSLVERSGLDNAYRWNIVLGKEHFSVHLFSKSISEHSVSAYKEPCAGVGKTAEGLRRFESYLPEGVDMSFIVQITRLEEENIRLGTHTEEVKEQLSVEAKRRQEVKAAVKQPGQANQRLQEQYKKAVLTAETYTRVLQKLFQDLFAVLPSLEGVKQALSTGSSEVGR
ncbi:FabD/lysophospholipase-like protein [Lizonia empirigonia]|nr:FabD/lysophospholipase-like protein [Lizonia empirigonia]